jgi:hypothetical protein
MSHEHNHLPEDLQEVERKLRANREEPSGLELDSIKLRAMNRSARSEGGSTVIARWRTRAVALMISVGLALSLTTAGVMANGGGFWWSSSKNSRGKWIIIIIIIKPRHGGHHQYCPPKKNGYHWKWRKNDPCNNDHHGGHGSQHNWDHSDRDWKKNDWDRGDWDRDGDRDHDWDRDGGVWDRD